MKTNKLLVFLVSVSAVGMLSCTKAVNREVEAETQERTIPATPGNINKIPAKLKCVHGEVFQFSVNEVKWADSYEWKINDEASGLLTIIEGQGTNMIKVKAADTDCVIPRRSVSVVAKNELGQSKERLFLAILTVGEGTVVPEPQPEPEPEPEDVSKKYGSKTWMTMNCFESGNDGKLGTAIDITGITVNGMTEAALSEINDKAGRFYTWYEAMTGIPACTKEQYEEKIAAYGGKDDAGNAFTLDGTEEGEYNVQLRGCCPEGWHVANCNDWWDLLHAIKSEYNVGEDIYKGEFSFNGGCLATLPGVTKDEFYRNGSTVKNMGNVGAWLRGGNGRLVDGGVWNQANETLKDKDATGPIPQFVSGADEVGFGWYPAGRVEIDGVTINTNAIGKYGFLWFVCQQDGDYARSLCISSKSMNLNTMNTKRVEANKLSRLNVRCVKNY